MPSDYSPFSPNTNPAVNKLKNDTLAQRVLREISTEIKNNAAQKIYYDEALKILARRKFCVKKFLEKLYQTQQTKLQITEIITTLEKCYTDLCNNVDRETTYLTGLANDVLNILEMCYGASLAQTITIRSNLDNSIYQKDVLIDAIAATLRLHNDLKNFFEIDFFNTIATYSTENVAPICHSNVPLISFIMARSIDSLKLCINKDVAQQALNEIPEIGAKEMFQNTFDIKEHAKTLFKEFQDIVNCLLEPQQRTIISYDPENATSNTEETITQQNAEEKSNETELSTNDKKKPTYAEAAKINIESLKPYVQLFGDDLKHTSTRVHDNKHNLISKNLKNNINPSPLKKSTSMLNIQNVGNNVLKEKSIRPSKSISIKKNNNPITRSQSMSTIANGRAQKQNTIKKKLQNWKSPFLAFGKLFKKSEDVAKTLLSAVPEDTEEEKKETEGTGENSNKSQAIQKKRDDEVIAEFAKITIQEKQQQENKQQSETKNIRPPKQLITESKDLLEKYYNKTKIENYKHLSDESIIIKNISFFLNSTAPLIEELTLAAKKINDKKIKKLMLKEKNELSRTSGIIKEQIIPNSIKNFSDEITKLGINTPVKIFIDLSSILEEANKANVSHQYTGLFASSRMKGFLTTITHLTKEYFFPNDAPLDQYPQEKLIESINDKIIYLAAICKIRTAFANIVSPNKKERGTLENIEIVEQYLEAIQMAGIENKKPLLKKFIRPSLYHKTFYTTLQYNYFELSELLALNDDFKPTEKDLYIADRNGAWGVIYLLLKKGANPFALYINGDMPFTNIIASGNSNNIIFSITLIEKYYDELNKKNKISTITNILFNLLSEKSKFNFEIRHAIHWLLEKNPTFSKIRLADNSTLEENNFFKELIEEKKLLNYLQQSKNTLTHKIDTMDKLHMLKDDQLFNVGPGYQMSIIDTMIVYAKLSIEEKIITLPELKNKIIKILNNIYKNIGIDRTLELIKINNLLKLNIYIPLVSVLAEYAYADSDIFKLLIQIILHIELIDGEQHKHDFINYPTTETNATLLHIALQYKNYQAATMLISTGSNLMPIDINDISAADLIFHPNYRTLALFEYLCDMPKEHHAKILKNGIYSVGDTENAHPIIMRLVELEDHAGHTLTEFLALHKKEDFVTTLLEHGSCAAAKKINSLYKIAQLNDCHTLSTYLQDHYKTILDEKMPSQPSTNPHCFYNEQRRHANSPVVHEPSLPVNYKLETTL